MTKSPVLLVIFSMLVLASLWHTVIALKETLFYSSLTHSTTPTALTWSSERISSEKFLLKGTYTFQFNGKNFEGTSVLSIPVFRNQEALQEAIPKLSEQPLFFDPTTPTRSNLERSFPLKEWCYSFVLWVISAYFVWLQFYIRKKVAG